MSVKIGEVQTFSDVKPDKAQVMKIGEEVMEVFSAWEDWREERELDSGLSRRGECTQATANARARMLDECADVIQAVCNLVAALGVGDFAPAMERCRERNEARGRL